MEEEEEEEEKRRRGVKEDIYGEPKKRRRVR
jgi:hypothetical protein